MAMGRLNAMSRLRFILPIRFMIQTFSGPTVTTSAIAIRLKVTIQFKRSRPLFSKTLADANLPCAPVRYLAPKKSMPLSSCRSFAG
jgi:hypothetical protein